MPMARSGSLGAQSSRRVPVGLVAAIVAGFLLVYYLTAPGGSPDSAAGAPADSAEPLLHRVRKPIAAPADAPAAAAAAMQPRPAAAAAAAGEGPPATVDRCADVRCVVPEPCQPGSYPRPVDIQPDGCCASSWKCEPAGPAPPTFTVRLHTTKGDIDVRLHRDWAPQGVDRFYAMVLNNFFSPRPSTLGKGIGIFRVVKDFVAQFGIHGDPEVSKSWRAANIKDDPVLESNKQGYLTFATAGKDTRTSQLFFNLRDNTFLDKSGFAPIGQVVAGLDNLLRITTEYGEQPNQGMIQGQGNKYLGQTFPNLDYINGAQII